MRHWQRALLAGILGLLAACGGRDVPPFEEAEELVVLTRAVPTTYMPYADNGLNGPSGFEHDLLMHLGEKLGKPVRLVIVDSDVEIYRRLKSNTAHMAAAWLSHPVEDAAAFESSQPFFKSDNVVLQHEADSPINSIDDLASRTLQVASGSQLTKIIQRLRSTLPTTHVLEQPDPTGLGLAEAVADRRIELAVVDEPIANIAQNYYPQLQAALKLGHPQDIVWIFPAGTSKSLIERVNAVLLDAGASGTLGRLADRYFAPSQRLTAPDTYGFIRAIAELLPKYRTAFEQAQVKTGLDWRLLAALGYQESMWDPLATSYTNVRGLMMLTEDTADRMGVSNRLDPRQSILGGAAYLKLLLDDLPESVEEPDRTWFALAAYNLGMGHLNGARALAKGLGVNPDRWVEMKTVLPLLAKPEYFARLKSGRGRGGEAVVLTERIRAFYDILTRYAPPYVSQLPAGAEPGLRVEPAPRNLGDRRQPPGLTPLP